MAAMSHRFSDDRERVKDATDIAQLIAEHVALKPKGREYVGLCPFHDDRRPSMYVVPAKRIFHCFVCGAGGDCYTFVQKHLNMEFREALEYLAERAHIPLTPSRPAPHATHGDHPAAPSRAELLAANATASDYFRAILRHPEHGHAARDTIQRRGITPDLADRFALGATADRWDGLALTIRSKSLHPAPFLHAGLLKKRDADASFYDTFRNRLIFPIADRAGRTIAFGARRLNDQDEPKYLNSPESPLFSKSATLYALHLALPAIQRERAALICEGYTDVIACHQAGFTNAVATLGTALTHEHARALRLACDRVVLLFDGDDAGQRAADRAAEVFFAEPIDVHVCVLADHTDAKDPDELLKRDGGPDLLRLAIDRAPHLLDYRFDRLADRAAPLGPAALARTIDAELASLIALGLPDADPVKRRLIVKRLAALAGLPDDAVLDSLARAEAAARARRRAPANDDRGNNPPSDPALAAAAALADLASKPLSNHDRLLGCLLAQPDAADAFDADALLDLPAYGSPLTQRVAIAIRDQRRAGLPHAIDDVLAVLASSDPDAVPAATTLVRRAAAECDHDPQRLRALAADCAASILSATLKPRPPASPSELIEAKRLEHARTGGNPRALPGFRKPST
ncbi:MAG: DNA primase [Phycisphaeraceae bacterium]|nr:MAG: DNA primase [Phycisphaeraceae bacterium]